MYDPFTTYMDYRRKILSIRMEYLKGIIDLDTAKARIQPLLDEMNIRGLVIAKQHSRKFTKLTFGYVMR